MQHDSRILASKLFRRPFTGVLLLSVPGGWRARAGGGGGVHCAMPPPSGDTASHVHGKGTKAEAWLRRTSTWGAGT